MTKLGPEKVKEESEKEVKVPEAEKVKETRKDRRRTN